MPEHWPEHVRLAFEKYAAMPVDQRSLNALAQQPDTPPLRSLQRWSAKHDWMGELGRRMKVEAEAHRKAAETRRTKVRETVETGFTQLAVAYSMEATGRCSTCKGQRAVNGHPCARCNATGSVDPLKVNVNGFRAVVHTLKEMWDAGSGEADAEEGGLSHEELLENQKAMLRKVGFDPDA